VNKSGDPPTGFVKGKHETCSPAVVNRKRRREDLTLKLLWARRRHAGMRSPPREAQPKAFLHARLRRDQQKRGGEGSPSLDRQLQLCRPSKTPHEAEEGTIAKNIVERERTSSSVLIRKSEGIRVARSSPPSPSEIVSAFLARNES